MKSFLKVKKYTQLFLLFCAVFALIESCYNKENVLSTKEFEVADFNPLINCTQNSNGHVSMNLSYTNAIEDGFILPNTEVINEGAFIFSFKLKNKNAGAQSFRYKIYYQNESYKFAELDSLNNSENFYASENFYGSWEDVTITFKSTPLIKTGSFYEVIDSFRIVGNPRDEQKYYKERRNQRWQRNPRVGNYRFMIVVTTEENIQSIPFFIQNIGQQNNTSYSNPFYYFIYGKGKTLPNLIVSISNQMLKVTAKPDLGKGIYINPINFANEKNKDFFSSSCGQNNSLYKMATFQQFIHYVDPSMNLENIPIIADVLKDNYSKTDYNWNRLFYLKEELISGTPQIAKVPCQTVFSDTIDKKIIIKNPKTEFGKWRKESVGVCSRNGLTYGKYRVKAKLTELLNKNNVWNGLTNAIWLMGQSSESWNNRRPCRKEGYLANYWGGANDSRISETAYSEIDFEIVKTPAYCPTNLFPPIYQNPLSDQFNVNSWNKTFPDEIIQDDGKLSVACTNWDMACPEPIDYASGCNPINYNEKQFESHRWTKDYRALTQKTMANDDELFASDYYYFEIDWKPEEIIWRIGPEPDKMFVVGYMNNTITSIPNNQMLLVITQEFHTTKWWPGSPYQQENTPFPANDIIGEIYEVIIE